MAARKPNTKMTREERERKAAEAYRLSINGFSAPQIGEKLELSEKTIDNLLRIQRTKVRKQRSKTQQQDDLLDFLAAQKAISAEMWEWIESAKRILGRTEERIEELEVDSDESEKHIILDLDGIDPASLASVASQAWDRIAKALGLYTTKLEHGASQQLLEQLLTMKQPVIIAAAADIAEFEDP